MYNFFDWFNLLFGIPLKHKSKALKFRDFSETDWEVLQKDREAIEKDVEKIWGRRK